MNKVLLFILHPSSFILSPSCPIILISAVRSPTIIRDRGCADSWTAFRSAFAPNNEDDMAKKRGTSEPKAVTAERAARLYKLLQLLGKGPQTRDALTRRLRLDVRGFYRDLELLHEWGIAVHLVRHRYILEEDADEVADRLPFPDPRLTLGEVRQLAKGRTKAHRKLQGLVAAIVK
jgi:hypothetical protein